jgi:YHS domain-containing protein
MQLNTYQTDQQSVTAGYACPCGCTPSLSYQRDGAIATSSCCCGNEFAVGPGAERALSAHDGFALETEQRTSGWGEAVTAAWLVGPSVHAEPSGGAAGHGHDHHHAHDDGGGHDQPDGTVADPVCGMRVVPTVAIEKGLHRQHAGVDYYFCGKGCYLDFGDDPERFLDPAYIPSM